MKEFIALSLLLLFTSNSFCQVKEDSKVLTSTISSLGFSFNNSKTSSTVNPTQIGKSYSFAIRPELTYGKVRNNSLFSYGASFALGWGEQSNNASGGFNTKSHSIAFSPVISYEKFYLITDRLYYTPFIRLSVGYQYSKQSATPTSSAGIQKGIISSFEFRPFSLTFSKNANTNFLFMIGYVALTYDRTKSYSEPTLYEGKTISNNFSFDGNFGRIGFGIQKIF